MEDIIGYVILFGFGLAIFLMYHWRKTKESDLALSTQNYPNLKLEIFAKKHLGKITLLIVQITSPTPHFGSNCFVELISRKREIKIIPSKEFDERIKPILKQEDSDKYVFVFDFIRFQKYIDQLEKSFSTVRFVVETDNGKKYKSHELAFNKNWSVYKPDSGKYN